MNNLVDKLNMTKKWTIRKYANDVAFNAGNPFDESIFHENLLLNGGITQLLDLLGGIGGTAYSNANAYLGVGDSTTAESAAQTGLQASTNKTYKPMATSFPSIAGQTITWEAVFGSGDANYSWQEFTVCNSVAGTVALNRKVSNQGTKVSGQTWTLDLAITFS